MGFTDYVSIVAHDLVGDVFRDPSGFNRLSGLNEGEKKVQTT